MSFHALGSGLSRPCQSVHFCPYQISWPLSCNFYCVELVGEKKLWNTQPCLFFYWCFGKAEKSEQDQQLVGLGNWGWGNTFKIPFSHWCLWQVWSLSILLCRVGLGGTGPTGAAVSDPLPEPQLCCKSPSGLQPQPTSAARTGSGYVPMGPTRARAHRVFVLGVPPAQSDPIWTEAKHVM